jgi:hypothetical protein
LKRSLKENYNFFRYLKFWEIKNRKERDLRIRFRPSIKKGAVLQTTGGGMTMSGNISGSRICLSALCDERVDYGYSPRVFAKFQFVQMVLFFI